LFTNHTVGESHDEFLPIFSVYIFCIYSIRKLYISIYSEILCEDRERERREERAPFEELLEGR